MMQKGRCAMEAEKRMKVDAGEDTLSGEKFAPDGEAWALGEGERLMDWRYPSEREVRLVEGFAPEGEEESRLLGYLHARRDVVKALGLWRAWWRSRETQTENTRSCEKIAPEGENTHSGEDLMEDGEVRALEKRGKRELLRLILVQYARMALEEAHGVPRGMEGERIWVGWTHGGKRVLKTWHEVWRMMKALGRRNKGKRGKRA